jgi:hypothetical protein
MISVIILILLYCIVKKCKKNDKKKDIHDDKIKTECIS